MPVRCLFLLVEPYFCGSLKTRRIISVFLLTVLCVQLLPLKQTIAWLFSSQMTEEMVHSGDDGKSSRSGDDQHKHFLPVYYPTLVQSIPLYSLAGLSDHHVSLKGRHADDIPTPPPNC
jgi:hypothetical protein